jgi:hypothetical protein
LAADYPVIGSIIGTILCVWFDENKDGKHPPAFFHCRGGIALIFIVGNAA